MKLLRRINNSANEQDCATAILTNQENERMIGDKTANLAFRLNQNQCYRCRFGARFIHVNKCFVYDIGDKQVCGAVHAGKVCSIFIEC